MEVIIFIIIVVALFSGSSNNKSTKGKGRQAKFKQTKRTYLPKLWAQVI